MGNASFGKERRGPCHRREQSIRSATHLLSCLHMFYRVRYTNHDYFGNVSGHNGEELIKGWPADRTGDPESVCVII